MCLSWSDLLHCFSVVLYFQVVVRMVIKKIETWIRDIDRTQLKCVLLGALMILDSSFHFMGIVFLAGTSEHWCHVPEISDWNLTRDEMRNISIPVKTSEDRVGYSQCLMYTRNYSEFSGNGFPSTENVSTEGCRYGWEYDRSQYTTTVVMQVCWYIGLHISHLVQSQGLL